MALQTYHVYSTLKRRGNVRFHDVSTRNTGSNTLRRENANAYIGPCKKSLMLFLLENFLNQTPSKMSDSILNLPLIRQ